VINPYYLGPTFNGQEEGISLSPGQAKFLYWFVGMVPILKAMTSITTYLGSKKKKLAELAKQVPAVTSLTEKAVRSVYTNVVSDFARQTVTCSFQLMSYFIVGDAIKAILKKVEEKKPLDQRDPGRQQVLMQAIPLTVQVIATILSRNFGAPEIQALFDIDPEDGKFKIPANESGFRLYLKTKTKALIDKSLTVAEGKPNAGFLRPLKASLMGTGAMMVYFGALVGVLYGISTGLEKAFPGTFKTKSQSKKQSVAPVKQPFNAVSGAADMLPQSNSAALQSPANSNQSSQNRMNAMRPMTYNPMAFS
jgi:hypothetical protein